MLDQKQRFAIIDHLGVAGADNASLHRVEKMQAIETAKAAGFVVQGDANILANPGDDHTQAVFADPDRAAGNAAQTCIGRNGRVEDMDGPLLFLCSDASAYVTGQILMVDGGFTAK